jgi:hypothetical protein
VPGNILQVRAHVATHKSTSIRSRPVFLVIIGIHVLLGLATVIAGAVAMLSNKGRGRHYFRSLLGVFVTMSALSFIRWTADYHLFLLGALSFAVASMGRAAVWRCCYRWPQLHLTGMGASYILM